MTASRRLRDKVVDGPASIGARSRLRRWNMLSSVFPDLDRMSIIDLGGTASTWLRAPVQPKLVTVLNVTRAELTLREGAEPGLPPWIVLAEGDACEPPPHLLEGGFDLVFCNSLLEHVGGHARRMDLARTIGELADRYWVQTPYRYFPLEPHFIFPLFQFMPLWLRGRVLRRWPLVHTRPSTMGEAFDAALDVELLSKTELSYYFPDARLMSERFGPMTKSIVAVKDA